MHPDRKIGIAMGILLVGVVAALFFRNEPLQVDGGLTLKRENEINQRLRDRDVTVFLEDQQPSETTDSASEPNWSLPDMLGDLQTKEDEVPVPIGGRGLPIHREVAEPQIAATEPGTSDQPVPFNPQPNEDEIPTADVSDESQSATEFIEYTVKFGDTLSEISQRFLGSQARFREIYEANKDRMDSPDRLRVGKAIRIPRVIR